MAGRITRGDRNPKARAAGRFRIRLRTERPGVVVTHRPLLYQPSFIFERTNDSPSSSQMRKAVS